MKKIIFLIIAGVIFTIAMSGKEENMVSIEPISHASMVLKWGGAIIYTDPVGGAGAFAGQPEPDLILLTDIHGDHLDIETLEALAKEKTVIISPMAVAEQLPSSVAGTLLVMKNGERTNKKTSQKINLSGFSIEAVPMYNLPGPSLKFHTKGRGNGYVIEKDGMRVYISGDTAGIPEMRALQDIDIAFIAMNLPYTMDVEEAAEAVLDFKPQKVYPYHYRTPEGYSDVAKFKEIVNNKNPAIEVVQLNWYSNNK
ncbi:MBL fold metallo-hydrolase [Candidatus Nomurabacteria bacterium RIFCSPLOWO2_02_40_28]|uniref:MBL fold metallo-hydrolase n=2 Tax=Candidatus Nomuraibacteriota TaxID=1752729 RepID=A0A837HTA5_9BACT|nr:MAG: hypothetical protein UT27_C0005G0023 [Candidatus Nomurabacteria bacterium GW2011_GWD2_39_12]KKR20289.1 MAG: hypothetical protein UT51_C0005G0022 [Candidatus Nomurabacteria bacterium GW2011_GWC2_39_41]KKR36535.1 MAG: hypothetical protein UT70_C0010G0022 [Candidatus Nomurabacteria bacterium GW2011_GWE2_40_10]KKR38382.1 MAG: hypothetical protein UT73_C0003G0022 [Candidatus Nomurabacteria bacterium GW2011_GWB1_40_11]KKR39881.1 MAG: hypothetical protein UT74_C0005G0098 [Parcubacteria group b